VKLRKSIWAKMCEIVQKYIKLGKMCEIVNASKFIFLTKTSSWQNFAFNHYAK